MMQDELKLGALVVADESASPLPLEGTQVTGQITGAIAAVTVTQRFGNPFPNPIELEYLFPLPHEGAVVDYEITIGNRTIKADLKEAKAAQQAYREAVEEGKRASLLEQRRPNLFAIQIGNVQPGETIITRLVYEDRLHYQDGAYEFIFPMGIAPRYHSPAHPTEGHVDAPVTPYETQVSPVEITLTLDPGAAISDPSSPTHAIALSPLSMNGVRIALAERTIPNKDFVLRYDASVKETRAAIWSSPAGDSETAVITLLPPPLDLAAPPAAREFIFVVDRSGSMSGGPMTQAKNALRACVRALNNTDAFMVQLFDDRVEWFAKEPQPLTQEVVNKLDQWLNSVDARGGTEIIGAIEAALAVPADKKRQRYVVFLTDGSVSADEEAIRRISKQRGHARIFTFGIGPSVNRYLLSKMAQMGRGAAAFVGVQDDLETTITRFQDKVSYPALYDLKLEWQGAESWDTYPVTLPDLYIGEPLEIVTKIKRKAEKVTLKVSGKLQDHPLEISATLPEPQANPTLLRLWARARIESLRDEQITRAMDEKIREKIISLALEHRIVTPYTSFVAVDSEVTAGGDAKKVNVAVPLPEGLEFEGFFGAAGGSPALPAMYMAAAPMPPTAMQSTRSPMGPAKVVVNRFLGRLNKPKAATGHAMMDRLASYGSEKFEVNNFEIPTEPMASPGGNRTKLYEVPIEVLHLSQSIFEALKNVGLTNVGELLEMFEYGISRFLSIKGIDLEQIEEIGTILRQHGYADNLSFTPDFATIEERLKWLARSQNVQGYWESNNVEITAAAVIAFVRAGHTTRNGHYRTQVNKAAQWLKDQLAQAQGLDLMLAARALQELHAATGDYAISVQLPAPASDVERVAQGETVTLPTQINTLDDVRIMALSQGNVTPPEALQKSVYGRLVKVWMAVGKG